MSMADHFFNFIPPGFKFNLSIPKSFLTNFNGWRRSCNSNTAILRRGCHKWPVHISDGGVFGDGWRKFVLDNGVQEFDFIVFKHQGNMVFDFFVFDNSTCERQYPDLFEKVQESLTQSDSLHTHKRSKMVDKHKRTDDSSQSKDKFLRPADDGDRCFVAIMTPYYIRTTRLHVPMKFARSNGLITKRMHTQVVLVDESKRTWPATLHIKATQIRLMGWRKLIIKNELKVGDTCMFELVKAGENPVFNFYNLGKKDTTHNHIDQTPKETSLTIKEETGSTRYFMSTLKPYSFKRHCLYIPAEFSTSNDLRTSETILRDDKGRLWKVQLNKIGENRLYLGCGFRDFLVANGLIEGDAYTLELVENNKDKPPVFNFSSILGKKPVNNHNKINKTSSTIKKVAGSSVSNLPCKLRLDEKQIEKRKSPIVNDTSNVHKHIQVKKETKSTCSFISTLKPYNFKNSSLYLPVEFSISNDLRKGEMILIDDKGRSWKVQLNKSGKNQFYVGCGLRDFWVANGLTEGDAYKFEIVENDKDKPPVVNFSLKVDSTLSGTENCRYYIGELTSYHIEKSMLYLPSEFARKNGLFNKDEMILKNADERSWTVKIKHNMSKYCYVMLRQGWKEFCDANGLKEGDLFKLELASNGKIPVANFYVQKVQNS